MKSIETEKPKVWTVKVYRKLKKLSPVKKWQPYLCQTHNQYHGGCFHYLIPDTMLPEALALGAKKLTGPFSCMDE